MGELVAGNDIHAKSLRDGLALVEEIRVIASQPVIVKRVDIDNIGSGTVFARELKNTTQNMIQHNRGTLLSGGYRRDSAEPLFQNNDTPMTI